MLQLLHNHCVLRARAGLLRCARAHTTCACTSLGARARRHCRMRSAPAPKALARARTCPRGEYSPRELLHARRCRLPSGCAFIPLVPPKGGLRRKRLRFALWRNEGYECTPQRETTTPRVHTHTQSFARPCAGVCAEANDKIQCSWGGYNYNTHPPRSIDTPPTHPPTHPPTPATLRALTVG